MPRRYNPKTGAFEDDGRSAQPFVPPSSRPRFGSPGMLDPGWGGGGGPGGVPAPGSPAPAGPGGGGPGGGGFSVPAMPDLSIYAKPSPEMAAATEAWKKRMTDLEGRAHTTDPNLQWQIDEYKKRLGTDNTTRAIEQAASVIRDQAAGMGEAANAAGARTGRGEGLGAAGIGDASAAALARSASQIELDRQKQLDQLLLGGQSIMAAPGQQAMGYESLLGQTYAMNPYEATAKLGLSQQGLGLEAYLGNLRAMTDMTRAQADMYGSPLQWYSMLLNGM